MRAKIHMIAWTSLVLAACAWGIVWYTGTYLTSEALSRATRAAVAEQQLDRLAYAKRISALANDTEAERDRLDVLTRNDIVSIVNMIESAGKSSGVTSHVSDALPIGGTHMLPGNVPLQSVVFIVEAQGSFSALMRVVAAFERLPVPSVIDQLELRHDTGAASKSTQWRLSARIRVLTTADVSS